MTISMAFIAPGLVNTAVEVGFHGASALRACVILRPNGRTRSSGSVWRRARWIFIQLYRWFASILQVLTIIRPETPSSKPRFRGPGTKKLSG
jgi:hypothetical protein